MTGRRIKLLRVPHFFNAADARPGLKCEYCAPLAMGLLKAHARRHGIDLELDDLNIKLHYDDAHPSGRPSGIDHRLFFDKARVTAYVSGRPDAELAAVAEAILRKTDIDGFDIVLLSCPSPSDISPLASLLLLAKHIKKRTKAVLVAGGVTGNSGSGLWRLGLRKRVLDYVVEGPGEAPLVDLLGALERGAPLQGVRGLRYLRGSRLRAEPEAREVLPAQPRFDGLPLDLYRWFPDSRLSKLVPNERCREGILILPYRFSIGCPYRCAFCKESKQPKTFLFIPPEEAAGHLQELSGKHGTKYFFFMHSTFNFSKPYTERLCDEIIRRGLDIRWTDCGSFRAMDRRLLEKMRKAGAVRLYWGLETASPRMLQAIGKGTTVRQAAEMLKASHEAGIWNGLEIICGLPHERREDIQLTIDFINRNAPYIDGMAYNKFKLLGDSRFHQEASEHGIENIRMPAKRDCLVPIGEKSHLPGWAFDEKDGLCWSEKREQIMSSYKEVSERTRLQGWESSDFEGVLFYLYEHCRDKAHVRSVLEQWHGPGAPTASPPMVRDAGALRRLLAELDAEVRRRLRIPCTSRYEPWVLSVLLGGRRWSLALSRKADGPKPYYMATANFFVAIQGEGSSSRSEERYLRAYLALLARRDVALKACLS